MKAGLFVAVIVLAGCSSQPSNYGSIYRGCMKELSPRGGYGGSETMIKVEGGYVRAHDYCSRLAHIRK